MAKHDRQRGISPRQPPAAAYVLTRIGAVARRGGHGALSGAVPTQTVPARRVNGPLTIPS